jgi:DNA-3-methyladenine glycosylase II
MIFNNTNFTNLCDSIAAQDKELSEIIKTYGYPPMWTRTPDFTTLIHIILEQQVSLASAKAALDKIHAKLGGTITPEKLLLLSDTEMRECYFSRQKMVYARHLAQSITSGELNLQQMTEQPDDIIRAELKKIKGIGDWTADIFLLMGLQRTNIFPIGDLAMVNSMKRVKQLPATTTKEELLSLAEKWKPHRSIATMLLWHHYLSFKPVRNKI